MTDAAFTPYELAGKLRLGWNLGNTFDAPRGETSWGSPVTRPEIFKRLHSLGFETVRIPVSWHLHTDENLTVSPEFMDRVNEVVDYAYNEGMYVILNIHHDDRMFQPTAEGAEAGKSYLAAIWRQIALRFSDYGDRLIMQGMNEPRMLRSPYEWHLKFRDPVCLEAMEHINEFNQVFTDTVRQSGGNNALRWLLVPSYAAAPQHTWIDHFRLPDDPAKKLIVSVHSYNPVQLCLMANPAVTHFDELGERELVFAFDKLKKRFVDSGVPVLFDEMGMLDKNNPDDRYRWAKFFTEKAREYGTAAVWWDNGGHDFRLFDRRALKIYETSECVLRGLNEGIGDGFMPEI